VGGIATFDAFDDAEFKRDVREEQAEVALLPQLEPELEFAHPM
jgi:hypothetical protein